MPTTHYRYPLPTANCTLYSTTPSPTPSHEISCVWRTKICPNIVQPIGFSDSMPSPMFLGGGGLPSPSDHCWPDRRFHSNHTEHERRWSRRPGLGSTWYTAAPWGGCQPLFHVSRHDTDEGAFAQLRLNGLQSISRYQYGCSLLRTGSPSRGPQPTSCDLAVSPREGFSFFLIGRCGCFLAAVCVD